MNSKHIRAAALISIGVSAAVLADTGQVAQPTVFAMKGGTIVVDGKSEVRLRWSVKEGRIPEGTFNVYRIDVADRSGARRATAPRVKVSAAPIAMNLAAASAVKLTPEFKFNDLLVKARQTVPGVSEQEMFSAEKQGPRPTSS